MPDTPMYRTLFSLAGLAIIAWLPLILLPRWKWTRRLADSAVFPLYLALLYLVGIVGVLAELGPGIMRDFGRADGVLALLRTESLALVAWIHILAFDQLVGLGIYRDNMRRGVVPMPVQSVILFLTLMFGPVGFLVYYAARLLRPHSVETPAAEAVSSGLRSDDTTPAPVRFADFARDNSIIATVVGLWKREPVLIAIACAAFLLAGVCAAVAAMRGGWSVPPEGRLLEAFKFELGVGIYFLTLALLLPLAGMSPRGRLRWLAWTQVVAAYFISVETLQALRGLDPRFTEAGGRIDQLAGIVFGVTALAILVLFIILVRGFFRRDALRDHPPLRLGIRYGVAAITFAFGSGVAMSLLQTRFVAAGGSLMPMHAAGFHGLQAVPLVALLVGCAALSSDTRMRLTHAAGIGWLLLCAGLLWQALAGRPPLVLSPALLVAASGGALWISCLVAAAVARMRGPGALPQEAIERPGDPILSGNR